MASDSEDYEPSQDPGELERRRQSGRWEALNARVRISLDYGKHEILDSQATDTQVIANLSGDFEPEGYVSDGHKSEGYESVHDRWHELSKQMEMNSDGVEPEHYQSTDNEDGEETEIRLPAWLPKSDKCTTEFSPQEAEKPKKHEYLLNPDGSVWNPFGDHPHPIDPEYKEYWMSKGIAVGETGDHQACAKSKVDPEPALQSCSGCDEKARELDIAEARLIDLRAELAQAENIITFFLRWRPMVLREAQGRIKLLEELLEGNGHAVPDSPGLQIALGMFEKLKRTTNDEEGDGGMRKRVKVEADENTSSLPVMSSSRSGKSIMKEVTKDLREIAQKIVDS